MKIIRFILVLVLTGFLLFSISNLLGVNGENNPIAVQSGTSRDYVKVSRILQNKCVDCHSPGMTRMPIYSELPIARQLIENDIQQGSERFILSPGIYSGKEPFTPLMLARLEHVIINNNMPPALYLTMHWNGSLSADEKQTVLTWIAKERGRHPWSNESAEGYKGEPVQPLPLSVELNPEKVALGNQLFHDTLLSGDNTLSCASCHALNKGGTDQAQVATGIRGQQGPINSPTVYNAMYNLAQFWDGRAKDLQAQAAGPVANPVEMGADWDKVITKLNQDSDYTSAFSKLYPEQGLTKANVTDAIAVFEESLVTPNSRFDQYLRGHEAALNPDEKAGYELFKNNCTSCHFGPALGGLSYEKMGVKQDYFAMRGGDLTEDDNGRYNVTKNEIDRYAFKVPVLRNVELTYPYFHDGSVNELPEAVRIMGITQLGKNFSADEIDKMVAFLKTLTGEYQGASLSSLKDPQ
ncbi:cytochrome-c peroxidase [Methyloprofundus sedimenti]|uniref:Cytochrome-c peroxidase n=1 Tax=Methyloprofundus sedimenti TaxID=1420851 RepID=A0A1V8M7C3_9GAMM|nr:cytochrome c peroxidase [Methyloprofundus sedimenti]OQK17418.1 cytochrome-c peroxidase [Methyloprofundus sedimenti]